MHFQIKMPFSVFIADFRRCPEALFRQYLAEAFSDQQGAAGFGFLFPDQEVLINGRTKRPSGIKLSDYSSLNDKGMQALICHLPVQTGEFSRSGTLNACLYKSSPGRPLKDRSTAHGIGCFVKSLTYDRRNLMI